MAAHTHFFMANALNHKTPAIRADQRGAEIGVYAIIGLAITEALAGLAIYIVA